MKMNIACVVIVLSVICNISHQLTQTFYDGSMGTYEKAKEFCKSKGLELPKIDNFDRAKDLRARLNNEIETVSKIQYYRKTHQVWIGMDKTKGTWKWNDGTLFDYPTSLWGIGEPNNKEGNANCAAYNAKWYWWDRTFLWHLNDVNCDSEHAIFCYKFEEDYFYDENVHATYEKAKEICKSKGLELPKIDSQEKHERVISHRIKYRIAWNNVWIGMDDKKEENAWKWNDGTAVDTSKFNGWEKGQPDNAQGNQDCAVYRYRRPKSSPGHDRYLKRKEGRLEKAQKKRKIDAWKWMDVSCGSQRPVFCFRNDG